jgi:hypothetical protein
MAQRQNLPQESESALALLAFLGLAEAEFHRRTGIPFTKSWSSDSKAKK